MKLERLTDAEITDITGLNKISSPRYFRDYERIAQAQLDKTKAQLVDLENMPSPLKGREQNDHDYQFTNGWNACVKTLSDFIKELK